MPVLHHWGELLRKKTLVGPAQDPQQAPPASAASAISARSPTALPGVAAARVGRGAGGRVLMCMTGAADGKEDPTTAPVVRAGAGVKDRPL